jgi:antitoxin ParD1/3/4
MPTRNISLTDHYDQLIESLIASGRYRNASQVLRAGLRLLDQEAVEEEAKLGVLRKLACEAFTTLDRGEGARLEGIRNSASSSRDWDGGTERNARASAGQGLMAALFRLSPQSERDIEAILAWSGSPTPFRHGGRRTCVCLPNRSLIADETAGACAGRARPIPFPASPFSHPIPRGLILWCRLPSSAR